jgi:hypothetical protein
MCQFSVEVVRKGAKDAAYVGRPTPLGNPYVLKREEDRDAVCDAYERWFSAKIEQKDPAIVEALRALYARALASGHLRLACFCAPRRCHAETIARWLLSDAQEFFGSPSNGRASSQPAQD